MKTAFKALTLVSTLIFKSSVALAAAGSTASATRSATGSGLPGAGIATPTLVLLFLAIILVFFGVLGLSKRKS